MDNANQIHLSITSLEKVLDQAKEYQALNPERFTNGFVKITKTAWRQSSIDEDTIEVTMLDDCSIDLNIEE